MTDKQWFIDAMTAGNPVGSSPVSTYGKKTFDTMKNLSDFTKKSREQINYHHTHGTEIGPIIESIVAGTIGEKVNIQARTKSNSINTQFESLIKEHGRNEHFNVNGEWHRDQNFRLIEGFTALHGGIIIRYHYNTAWKIPIRTELIPVSKVDTSKHNVRERLIHGLQKDKYNKTIGIYLYTDDLNCQSTLFPMDDIIFYSVPWITLDQTLAVSKLVTILHSLDDIFEYTTAEVKSAVEKAKTGVYWHTEIYSTIMQALNEVKQANGTKDNITIVKEAKELLNDLGARGVGVSGATPIMQDDKITTLGNNPESMFEQVNNQIELKNSAAMGTSQVAAYKDGSKNNYAGLQAIRGHDEGSHKIRFDNLKNKVIDDYLRRLFDVGVKIGRISLSSKKFYGKEEEWFKWDILRTASITLDEQKKANAISKRLISGTTTLTKVYADDGLDYQEEALKQVKVDVQVINEARQMYITAGLAIPDKYKTQEELNAQGVSNEENK